MKDTNEITVDMGVIQARNNFIMDYVKSLLDEIKERDEVIKRLQGMIFKNIDKLNLSSLRDIVGDTDQCCQIDPEPEGTITLYDMVNDIHNALFGKDDVKINWVVDREK